MIGLDQAATANLLRGLAQVASRLDALTARVLAHAVGVRVEETNGATTTATWWADATHRTRATAHRDVKLAVALGRFTALAEALAEGRVNTEQAHAIARSLGDLETEGPEELEPVVVEQAEKHLVECADGFDAKHLRVLGRHVLTVVAPEVGEAHELVGLVPDDAEQMDRPLDQGKGRAAALAVLQRREIGRRYAETFRHLRQRDAAALPQFPDAPSEGRHGPCPLSRRRRI